MTLPYGATKYAFREFVQDYIRERIESGAKDTFGELGKGHRASGFLAEEIYEAIKATVVKAMEAMDWLQGVAKIAARESVTLLWTTPMGLPVHQGYLKQAIKRVQLKVQGRTVKLCMRTEGGRIDLMRQIHGVAPNFVHSMDAAALIACVSSTPNAKDRSWAMIHDSYGTHACDVSALSQDLRRAFVGLYSDRDVLQEFYESAKERLPETAWGELIPPPKSGTLNLDGVLHSKYFFS